MVDSRRSGWNWAGCGIGKERDKERGGALTILLLLDTLISSFMLLR